MSTSRTANEAASGHGKRQRYVDLPVLGKVTWEEADAHVTACIEAMAPNVTIADRAYRWHSEGYQRAKREAGA